jgi:hypothetical protein
MVFRDADSLKPVIIGPGTHVQSGRVNLGAGRAKLRRMPQVEVHYFDGH